MMTRRVWTNKNARTRSLKSKHGGVRLTNAKETPKTKWANEFEGCKKEGIMIQNILLAEKEGGIQRYAFLEWGSRTRWKGETGEPGKKVRLHWGD